MSTFQESLPKFEIDTWIFNLQSYCSVLSLWSYSYSVWVTGHILTFNCFHHKFSSTEIIIKWKPEFVLILRLVSCIRYEHRRKISIWPEENLTVLSILLSWQVSHEVSCFNQHLCKQPHRLPAAKQLIQTMAKFL